MTELDDAAKASIDAMTLEEMLRKWRFAPLGTFQDGDPHTEYFVQVMGDKRRADPAGWTAASKAVGWGR